MKFQLTLKKIEVLSDVFTNLSAGFFGAVIVFPGIFGIKDPLEFLVSLTLNASFGIVSLIIAFALKEKTK